MNIINAWLLPDCLSIWTNVGSENIIDDKVQGKFNVLKVLQSGTRELKMYRRINCSINKENLYNILEVYNKEFSEYSHSFKEFERD